MLFPLGFSLVDHYGRVTTRSFQVEAATFADAQAVVAAFVPDYQASTQLQLFEARLTDRVLYAGAPGANANVDEGMTISAALETPGKKASISVPTPVVAIRNSDGSIDIDDPIMVALLANYTAATNYVTASDGEKVTTWIKASLDK